MTSVFLIQRGEDRKPIITASTLEKAEALLNEYMGIDVDPSAKYHGFDMWEYNGGYPSNYLGNYRYTDSDGESFFLLYCLPIDSQSND